MNVIDSSGWIEYFTGDVNADFFAPAILDTAQLIVPSVSIYEVFKVLMREGIEDIALRKIAQMSEGIVVHLDMQLSLEAAKISLDLQLPMADSIILATAQAYNAVLWTQDADFEGIPNVRYTSK